MTLVYESYKLNEDGELEPFDKYYVPSKELIENSYLKDMFELGDIPEETQIPLPDYPNDDMQYYHTAVDLKEYPVLENGEPDIDAVYDNDAGKYKPSCYKNLRPAFYEHPDALKYDPLHDYFMDSIKLFEQFLSGDLTGFVEESLMSFYILERVYWHADFMSISVITTHIEKELERMQMHKTPKMWREAFGIPDALTKEEKDAISRRMGWEETPPDC